MAQLNFSILDLAQKGLNKIKQKQNLDTNQSTKTDFSKNLDILKNSNSQANANLEAKNKSENLSAKQNSDVEKNLQKNTANASENCTEDKKSMALEQQKSAQKAKDEQVKNQQIQAEKNNEKTKAENVRESDAEQKAQATEKSDQQSEKQKVDSAEKSTKEEKAEKLEKAEKNQQAQNSEKAEKSDKADGKDGDKLQDSETSAKQTQEKTAALQDDAENAEKSKADALSAIRVSEDSSSTDAKSQELSDLELATSELQEKSADADLVTEQTEQASKTFDFANFFAQKNLDLDEFRKAVADLDISQELKDKLVSLSDANLKSVLEDLRKLFDLQDVEKLADLFDKLQNIFIELAIKLDGKDSKNFKEDILNLTKQASPILATKLRKLFEMMPQNLSTKAQAQSEAEALIKDLLKGQANQQQANQAQIQARTGALSNASASADLNLELEDGISRLVQDKLEQNKVLSKQELNAQAQKILEAKGLENLNSLIKTARQGIDFLSTNSLSANPTGLASAARGANLPSLAVFNQAGTFNSEALMARINMMQSRNLKVADLRLDPPELGSLKVRIRVHNEQTSIHFQSPHPHIREILEQSLPRLREMLQESGVNVADAGVSDDDFAAGQNAQTSAESEERNKGNSSVTGVGDEFVAEDDSQKDSTIALDTLVDYYA